MLVGFLAYGVSLALFVVGLRHLGAARTGAYFSVAPFFGAVLALAGGEPITAKLSVAGLLMGLGVGLHLTESHAHAHVHEPMEHEHEHAHDEHNQHAHPWAPGLAMKAGEKHTHPHRHEAMEPWSTSTRIFQTPTTSIPTEASAPPSLGEGGDFGGPRWG